MPVESLVIGLSGEEIITDVLDQVEKALRTDCNLRPTDSYGQGYSGKVSVDLKLIGMDTVSVNVSSALAPTSEAKKIIAEKLNETTAVLQHAQEVIDGAEPQTEGGVAAITEQIPIVIDALLQNPEAAERLRPVEVKAEIEIPQEPDVNAVRERSGQGIPFESVDTKTGETTTKRRKYVKSTAMATGHAEDF